ncbi:MAG: response regulator [Phycisphaerae bacterium]|jgi:DNA-binding response OmpR family regulator|nr:response regulator [Phycisphaerae bacterium]
MPRRGAQILLVDDEVEIQHVLARTLERAGFQVDAVGSFREARDALCECRYHLLLVDLSLPDQSGIDLIRDIRGQDDSPSVIIITGHPSVRTVTEGMQLGVRNYLTKPISPAALVDAVRSVLFSDGVLINTEEEFIAELGQRLKAARHAADLTMKAVGERIGISQAQISQIEAGLSAPSMTTLFRLARALRVKMADLFKGM